MNFNNLNLFLGNMFDSVTILLRGLVVVGWFLRKESIELMYGFEFISMDGIGTKVKGGRGGGGLLSQL